MLQPFEPYRKIFMDKGIEMKKFYLVSQTYERGRNPFSDPPKTPLLLTGYSDIGLAKIHLNAVKKDKYAAIIDLQKPEHKQKVLEMLQPLSEYALYWSVVRSAAELESKIDLQYKDQMRRYISKNTNWQIGRDDSINPKLQLIFGELFITLKYRGEIERIPFARLEQS